ncbi:hypothetical protein NX059_010775 [Plenodomus lindquistii]|nr:hypothetical protein NX059_010775 [Plenodomus lindquistii]
MSFGFSVSDFVLAAEKAYTVYKKCKDAPAKHLELTQRVERLRDVLYDTERYLVEAEREGRIPQSQLRLTSLHSTCTGCNATLDEVDEFLEKYGKVGTDSGAHRFISRLKFINSDSDGLIRKLESDTTTLSLRLTSLTSLSVLSVQRALGIVVESYRAGKKEPTVISRAVIESQPGDGAEMFEQISIDLEEEDVNPESILLNKGYLQDWLQDIVKNGGLEEGSSHSRLELPVRQPRNTSRKDMVEEATSHNDNTTPTNSHAVASTEAASFSSLRLREETFNATLSLDDNENLYDGSDDETTGPEDSITVAGENLALREHGATRPRSESTASSFGKPDNWRPFDKPAPKYVQEKLLPLFHEDPFPDPTSGSTRRNILRAFHQADYSDQGFLARRTVLQHLSTALAGSELSIDSDMLERITLSFDSDRDGQFNSREFLGLVQDLIKRAEEARKIRIATQFSTIIQEAKLRAYFRRSEDYRFFLHWGFARVPGMPTRFKDTILDLDVTSPPKVMEASSFSVMAWEANKGVDRISDFEEEWVGIIPKFLQAEYLEPLQRVKTVARAFTLLENRDDRLALSDLDAACSIYELASKATTAQNHSTLDKDISTLIAAQQKCVEISDTLIGFTASLDVERRFEASVHNFGKFQAWWKHGLLAWRANQVVSKFEDWEQIKRAVDTYRSLDPDEIKHAEESAKKVAHVYTLENQSRIAKLLVTPWIGEIRNVQLRGGSKSRLPQALDSRKVFLELHVVHKAKPEILVTTEKRHAIENVWYPRDFKGNHEKLTLAFFPDQIITVIVMHMDSKNPQGLEVQRFNCSMADQTRCDFSHREVRGSELVDLSEYAPYGSPYGSHGSYGYSGGVSVITRFNDDTEFEEERRKLSSTAHWLNLFSEHPRDSAQKLSQLVFEQFLTEFAKR